MSGVSKAVESPVVRVDWSTPGGAPLSGVPPALLAAGRALLARVEPRPGPEILPLADRVHQRTAGRFLTEMKAWAAALGVDWRELTLANVSYDIVLASFGCSTIALATPEGPVLARNMDWWPEDALARASVALAHAERGAVRFANAAWPGAVGAVTGWSARGFGMAMNAVSGLEGADPSAYPTLLHFRRVLEDAAGFADAVRMLAEERIVASALFIVVGTTNDERVVVERTPTRHALRRPRGDEPLLCTNDYRALTAPEARPDNELTRTTCWRFNALQEDCGRLRTDRPVGDEQLLSILAEPPVAQQITAQHIIIRPRAGTMRLLVPGMFVA